MSKQSVRNILFGIVAAIAVMAAMFYFFLFPNPLRIYQANLLKWIPLLICLCAMTLSGWINRETPVRLLPLLFLPFLVFDLFNFLNFPFSIALIVVGVLSLVIPRNDLPLHIRSGSAFMAWGIVVFFLFAQPLIIEQEGFGTNEDGSLKNATVLWDFIAQTPPSLPSHTLLTTENDDFNIERLKGKTYFISFWATWCVPCIEDMPQLNALKKQFQDDRDVAFVDISIDDERELWKAFLAEHAPSGLQLISKAPDETRRALQISSLPLHFIADSDGEYKAFTSLETASKALEQAHNTRVQ